MDDIDEYISASSMRSLSYASQKNQMRKTEKYGETIEAIKQEIGQKYADPGLSLYSLRCSERYEPRLFRTHLPAN